MASNSLNFHENIVPGYGHVPRDSPIPTPLNESRLDDPGPSVFKSKASFYQWHQLHGYSTEILRCNAVGSKFPCKPIITTGKVSKKYSSGIGFKMTIQSNIG